MAVYEALCAGKGQRTLGGVASWSRFEALAQDRLNVSGRAADVPGLFLVLRVATFALRLGSVGIAR